ncbi:hypothetical protein D3C87_1184680 [compost metagenome]
MPVTQHRDVVEHVEVRAALHVDQVIAPAAFDARRVDVIVFLRAGETGVATGEQSLRIELSLSIAGQPQQGCGRRAQRLPGRGARRRTEQRCIDRRTTAQLHDQRPVDRAQHLAFDQRCAAVQQWRQAPQPHAQLRAIQLQHTLQRLMNDTGKRRLDCRAMGHAQLDM